MTWGSKTGDELPHLDMDIMVSNCPFKENLWLWTSWYNKWKYFWKYPSTANEVNCEMNLFELLGTGKKFRFVRGYIIYYWKFYYLKWKKETWPSLWFHRQRLIFHFPLHKLKLKDMHVQVDFIEMLVLVIVSTCVTCCMYCTFCNRKQNYKDYINSTFEWVTVFPW